MKNSHGSAGEKGGTGGGGGVTGRYSARPSASGHIFKDDVTVSFISDTFFMAVFLPPSREE
jgi:hypothetical protein